MCDAKAEVIGVQIEALSIYVERRKAYGDGWQAAGWPDSLHHIRSKAKRILGGMKKDDRDEKALIDDALDLMNYTAFFIANLRAGRDGQDDEL